MDQILKNTHKYNLLIGLAYVGLSLFFWSAQKTLGIALGASIMMLNFYIMAHLIKKAFGEGKIQPLPLVLYLIKFIILAALFFFIVAKWHFVDKVFFLIGTSVVLISLLLAGVKTAKEKADEGNNVS